MSGFMAALGQKRSVSDGRNSTPAKVTSASDIEAGISTNEIKKIPQYTQGSKTGPGFYNGPFDSSEIKEDEMYDKMSDLGDNEVDPLSDTEGGGNINGEALGDEYYSDEDDDQRSGLTETKELTKNNFIVRIKSLNRRKKWAETAIRR